MVTQVRSAFAPFALLLFLFPRSKKSYVGGAESPEF